MSGQFDDADAGDATGRLRSHDDDDDFVRAMRNKMMQLSSSGDPPRPAAAAEDAEDPAAASVNDAGQSGESEHGDYYYDDYDDDIYDDDDDLLASKGCLSSSSSSSHHSRLLEGAGSSRINLNASHGVSNAVDRMQHLESSKRGTHTGRDDRATSEQCMDPRTRMILFRMLSSGFLELVDGCLSTGKEANVYYAKAGRVVAEATAEAEAEASGAKSGGGGGGNSNNVATFAPLLRPGVTEYAVKIYKTSILVFKDRDKYVSGEHRWRKGYCRSNPRKMVKVWAEKEMRNYRRIHAAGIRTPAPVLLKGHVLVMEFLGRGGWPSPRIRDANLGERRMREAYVQTVCIMRHMYRRCRLVHGDLSEYNLLWHENEVYVIDVSQSVELDHPSALDFLRKDCGNVNDFFQRAGNLTVMTTRQLFEFVTSSVLGDTPEAESAALDSIMSNVDERADRMEAATDDERRARSQRESVEEAVFMSQFLPRSLDQVADYDVGRIEEGDVEETYARAVAALTGNGDVVEAQAASRRAAAVGGSTANNNADSGSMHVLFSAHDGEEEDGPILGGEDGQVDPANGLGVEATDDRRRGDGETEWDDDSDAEEEEGGFVKVAMTPEEAAAARAAIRDARRANKREVKEANSEKRKNKIKKKDKQRAINKTKGNKKKK